jgi:hypothetical protein
MIFLSLEGNQQILVVCETLTHSIVCEKHWQWDDKESMCIFF